ncbi:sulfite exporter TauE/SafE family protein [Kiloniella antarctica]|uniref:Probable membrane transporter protein n=1 Tax=Kiloniella antarctica TaxID=1550907 RepID=A0ABW5BPP6_9PROT
MIPADLTVEVTLLLIAASFITSGITTAVGLGGGLVMLAIMANVLPVVAIIPLHGAVQTANNTSRAYLLRRHINWKIVIWFSLGGIAGITFASQIVVTLPLYLLQLIMGLFILYSAWGPKFKNISNGRKSLVFGGVISAVTSMFIGASGPIAAAFLPKSKLSHLEIVSNHAAIMLLQHSLKIIALGLLGFVFTPWVGLLVAMLLSGFLGSLAGRSILWRIPERMFKIVFNTVLTLLAFRMLYQAIIQVT